MYGNNAYQPYSYQGGYSVPNYMQRAYNTQPQQMAQPMQQMPMQSQPQMQYEIPIQDVRFVTSEEAKAYIVMPNSKALLIDKSGMAYIKTADNMGQSQTQYFRFEAVNADGTPIRPQEPIPQVDFDDFIKKEDLDKLGFVKFDEYSKLLTELETIKKSISVSRPLGKSESAKGGTQ